MSHIPLFGLHSILAVRSPHKLCRHRRGVLFTKHVHRVLDFLLLNMFMACVAANIFNMSVPYADTANFICDLCRHPRHRPARIIGMLHRYVLRVVVQGNFTYVKRGENNHHYKHNICLVSCAQLVLAGDGELAGYQTTYTIWFWRWLTKSMPCSDWPRSSKVNTGYQRHPRIMVRQGNATCRVCPPNPGRQAA